MVWHHHRSIRLQGYDYSKPGGYFITLCTQDREPIFGKITGGVFIPSEAGTMVTRYWLHIEAEYENIKLDEYIVMPDHMHMILWLTEEMSDDIHPSNTMLVRADLVPAPADKTDESMMAKIGDKDLVEEVKMADKTGPQLVRAGLVPALAEMATLRPTAGTRPAATPTNVGSVIGAYKSRTTCEYIRHVKQDRWKPFNKRIWQRNYYEHIIRNRNELERIRQYIKNNPLKWEQRNSSFTGEKGSANYP